MVATTAQIIAQENAREAYKEALAASDSSGGDGFVGLGGRLDNIADVRRFVLAGNARFTLVSKTTGARFTYRLAAPRGNKDAGISFLSVLTDSDNVDGYTFIGTRFATGAYRHGHRSSISPGATSAKTARWFIELLGDASRTALPAALEVWHEGRCGRCGRVLTVPESIANGIGPECAKRA